MSSYDASHGNPAEDDKERKRLREAKEAENSESVEKIGKDNGKKTNKTIAKTKTKNHRNDMVIDSENESNTMEVEETNDKPLPSSQTK